LCNAFSSFQNILKSTQQWFSEPLNKSTKSIVWPLYGKFLLGLGLFMVRFRKENRSKPLVVHPELNWYKGIKVRCTSFVVPNQNYV
jgi:hypothetical protein